MDQQMSVKSSRSSALEISSILIQNQFVKEYTATTNGVFSVLQQGQYAKLLANIEIKMEANEALEPEARGFADASTKLNLEISKLQASLGKLQTTKNAAFAMAIDLIGGESSMTVLKDHYHERMMEVLEASDHTMLLCAVQSYWVLTHPSLSKWEIRTLQLKTDFVPGLGYIGRFNKCRLMSPDISIALDAFFGSFRPEDILNMQKLRLRLQGSGGQEGNGFIDSLEIESFLTLLTAEANISLQQQPYQRLSHSERGISLFSETKHERTERKVANACTIPGHYGHSNDRCRAQGALAAPTKTTGPKKEKGHQAKTGRNSCFLCKEMGHHMKDCPQLPGALQGTTPVPSAAPRTSRAFRDIVNVAAGFDTRGFTAAERQNLAFVLTERTAAERTAERTAAAAASVSAEDTGTVVAARAFVVSAFSRSTIVQLGIDSMANRHLFSDRTLFDQTTIRFLDVPIMVTGVCGTVELREYGTAVLDGIRLNDVFYCPSTPVNVVSLAALRQQYPSWSASLPHGEMCLRDATGQLKIRATIINGIYLWQLNKPVADSNSPSARAKARALLTALERGAAVVAADGVLDVNVPLAEPATTNSHAPFMFMHRALGHPSLKRMRWLQKVFPRIQFGQFPPSIFCDACNEGKSKRGSIPAVASEEGKLALDFFYDHAHVDVKMSTTGGWNEIRFTAIIFSVWALHARTKDEIAGKIMAWLLMYNTYFAPTNGPIALFRADNEKALFPKSSEVFWDSYGVIRSFSAPYTPAHNNRAESAIRTVYMTSRCLVRDSPLEDLFWPFAVDYACFLLVRRPTSAAPQTTPYARIMRRAPTLPLIPFGTLGHWTPPPQHPMQAARHTFSARGFACHFLGFEALSETTMIIVCNGVIYKTIDVVFPRPGALLMTRDVRTGTTNHGAAAPVTHREEFFPGLTDSSSPAALPSSMAARPAATLAGRLYHVSAHDLDCRLCDKHTARRLLLCCEFCPAVAHIRCAGFTRVPEEQWICASCKVRPTDLANTPETPVDTGLGFTPRLLPIRLVQLPPNPRRWFRLSLRLSSLPQSLLPP